jgi:hypothetical protein
VKSIKYQDVDGKLDQVGVLVATVESMRSTVERLDRLVRTAPGT